MLFRSDVCSSDLTGKLSGSDFVDLHNRMHLSLKQTLRDAHHTAYVIYDLSSRSGGRGGLLVPLATLDFGPQNALGSIKIADGEHIPMGHYLMKSAGYVSARYLNCLHGNSLYSLVSGCSVSKSRKFKATDGQEYRWTLQPDGEWQVSRGYSQGSIHDTDEVSL